MKVSFIVPLYNCLAFTQAMLASLQQTVPNTLHHEIIFVDDGSTDSTREWLQSFGGNCRAILNEENLGFAASCNRGAAAARGEIFFFLNNDLVLLPRWIEPMLSMFARFAKAGLVGNVQLNASTNAVDHAGIFFNLKGKPEHDTTFPILRRLAGYRRVSALTGACFAVRSSTWKQFGGFDEGFRNGGEDVDLCLRAEAAGLRNYVSLRSTVRHHVSQSVGRKLRDEQNSQRLMLRWHETIAVKMGRIWCWHHLATFWPDPRDFPDQRLAREAFFHVLYLRSRPPAEAKIGAQEAIQVELDRWEALLANATKGPVRPARPNARPTGAGD
ncbi:MAG TPA: glycosyltransferase family 2 protein [Lacunisphaera sp.]|jgi:GT2 family glycosyltransferase